MARMAQVAMEVALIQHDHLLDVFIVVELDGIQVLVTEWVDGVDIRQLLTPRLLDQVKAVVDSERWNYVNDVIVTRAGFQSRLKPGVAISILRECLSALAALHREGFIHGDMKPSNIMVKRTGNSKIIDLGSTFHVDALPSRPTWTPRYAAVEVLEGAPQSPLSDLASLGYVFFEMLTGAFPFAGFADGHELVEAKKNMWNKLPSLLPKDVSRNATLVNLISRMIAPNPADRFSSIEEADLSEVGAAEIERQLVKTGQSTEYDNEIRYLMEELSAGGEPE
jgi:serine/threonine-protein kinase